MHSAYVLALLVGSVTGAGLLLTFYSLLVSRAEELLKYRRKAKQEARDQFDQHLKGLRQRMSGEDFRKKKVELTKDLEKMENLWGLPGYLGDGLIFSLLLYVATTVLSLIWFWAADPVKENLRIALSWTFGLATVILLISGMELLIDIRSALKRKQQDPAKPSDV